MTAASDQLRLAIVGCGAAARECHVPGIVRTAEVTLQALIDPVAGNAVNLLHAYDGLGGARGHPLVTDDLTALAGYVDAAIIATPHRFHAGVADQLLSAGIHCLVEKPMCMSVEECDQVVSIARANRRVVGPGHVRRLFPASPWVRDRVRAGSLGTVTAVDWLEGAPYDWPLVSPSLFDHGLSGGGVVIDAGSHVLDLLLWWFSLSDDDATVVSYRDSSRGGAESEAVVDLRIAGIPVHVAFSRLRSLRNTCRIIGSDAVMEVGIDVEAQFRIEDPNGATIEAGMVPTRPPAQAQWPMLFAEQLRNFAEACRGQETLYVRPEAGRRVVSLISECYARREPLNLRWNEVAVL